MHFATMAIFRVTYPVAPSLSCELTPRTMAANGHRNELLLVERHRAAGGPEKALCRGLVVVAGEKLRSAQDLN
jgi:hypothetical protein